MTRLDYTFDRQLTLEREDSRMEGYAEGRAEGHEEGFTEGRVKERILLISKKIEKDKSLKQIAEELEDTTKNIQPVYDAIRTMSADFNVDDVYTRVYL